MTASNALGNARERISSILNSTTNEQEGLLSTVRELGERASLKQLINDAVSVDSERDAIGRRSYSHINGFDKIVLLASDEPAYKLRLHIWWPSLGGPQTRTRTGDIHNHRWHFASAVLSGRFSFEHYELNEDGDEYNWYEYYSAGGSGHFLLKPLGSIGASRTFEGLMVEGMSYYLSNQVPHRVCRDESELVATLVLQGRPITNSTTVLSVRQPSSAEEPLQIPTPTIGEADLARSLGRLSEVLSVG